MICTARGLARLRLRQSTPFFFSSLQRQVDGGALAGLAALRALSGAAGRVLRQRPAQQPLAGAEGPAGGPQGQVLLVASAGEQGCTFPTLPVITVLLVTLRAVCDVTKCTDAPPSAAMRWLCPLRSPCFFLLISHREVGALLSSVSNCFICHHYY